MLDAIEKLLVLQDRDRSIRAVREELGHIPLERQQLEARLAKAQAAIEQAKVHAKHLESERKRLELEVDAKKQLIERYSLQQFQTKRNEEYKALQHEIDTCKTAITRLEDQQLEFMEQIDVEQATITTNSAEAAEARRVIDARLGDLASREHKLQEELQELQSNRDSLAGAVEESLRLRYERLLRQRGHGVLVGIQHGVCGGCHMQLSRQIVVSCQADQEIMSCPNCGRILYYTPDMNLAVAD